MRNSHGLKFPWPTINSLIASKSSLHQSRIICPTCSLLTRYIDADYSIDINADVTGACIESRLVTWTNLFSEI